VAKAAATEAAEELRAYRAATGAAVAEGFRAQDDAAAAGGNASANPPAAAPSFARLFLDKAANKSTAAAVAAVWAAGNGTAALASAAASRPPPLAIGRAAAEAAGLCASGCVSSSLDPAPSPSSPRCVLLQCLPSAVLQEGWEALGHPCPAEASLRSYPPARLLQCHCRARVAQLTAGGGLSGSAALRDLAARGGLRPLPRSGAAAASAAGAGEEEGDECAPYAQLHVNIQHLGFASTLLVLLMNGIIEAAAGGLTRLERRRTQSDAMSSVSGKIFVGQFLNTALILMLVHSPVPRLTLGGLAGGTAAPAAGAAAGGGGDGGEGGGGSAAVRLALALADFTDADQRWHSSVGAELVLTMLLNVVAAHVPFAAQALLQNAKVWLCQWLLRDEGERLHPARAAALHNRVHSQPQLLQALLPPPFRMEKRLPALLNTVFVATVFSPLLPLLLPIAAAGLAAQLLVDKYMLLHVCARPYYSQQLILEALGVLPWALFLRLAVSVWAFSCGSIYPSAQWDSVVSGVSALAGAASPLPLAGANATATNATAATAVDTAMSAASVFADGTVGGGVGAVLDLLRRRSLSYAAAPHALLLLTLLVCTPLYLYCWPLVAWALRHVVSGLSCGAVQLRGLGAEPEKTHFAAFAAPLALTHLPASKHDLSKQVPQFSRAQWAQGWRFKQAPAKALGGRPPPIIYRVRTPGMKRRVSDADYGSGGDDAGEGHSEGSGGDGGKGAAGKRTLGGARWGGGAASGLGERLLSWESMFTLHSYSLERNERYARCRVAAEVYKQVRE
jgi:hypothetical protein